MHLPCSASDTFHRIVDGVVRRSGGAGNLAQLRIHLGPGLDEASLRQAWADLARRAPIVRSRIVARVRGARFQVLASAPELELIADDRDLAQGGDHDLRQGLAADEQIRLRRVRDGLVLTWHHGLCDARGILGLLKRLPEGIREPWWDPSYRRDTELPPTAALRGRAAQAVVPLLRPKRTQTLLRLAGRHGNAAVPLRTVSTVLGSATEGVDTRIRATVGRFGETAFLLAAVAAALAEHGDGYILFPLAVDDRRPGETRYLANAHSYLFLGVDAGLARRDLAAAAKHLRDEHKAWIAADGNAKLLSAISWFPYAGARIARYQLGFARPGLAASACVANTGVCPLPPTWFGAPLVGIDHLSAIPGHPGIAVLFHRDARGLGFDTIVTGKLARRLAVGSLAERIRWHLCERELGPCGS